MSEDVITLNGLTRRFAGMDRPAVAPLNCTIRAGYVTGLVGPDGAGKTTFFNLLTGIYTPSSGEITYHLDNKVSSRHLKPQKMAILM